MPLSDIDCPSCGARFSGLQSICPSCGKNAPLPRRPAFRVIDGAALPPSDGAGRGDIIMTARDHAVLNEIVCLRMQSGDIAARILIEKLECARIVAPEDLPADVVTLGSRVVFSVEGGTSETRVLTHPDAHSISAWSLPVTTPRGAALLGLRAGAVTRATRLRGGIECIEIVSVIEQPAMGPRGAGMGHALRGERARATPQRWWSRRPPDDDFPPPAA